MTVAFFVPGIPVAKGSARAFVVKGRAIVTQTNSEKQKPWASAITYMAQEAGITPSNGAVLIRMVFHFPRPKSHFRANGELKDKSPLYHVSRPDTDKLVRLVFDALTGVAWNDDSQAQIISAMKVYVTKQYSSKPGVEIGINQVWGDA